MPAIVRLLKPVSSSYSLSTHHPQTMRRIGLGDVTLSRANGTVVLDRPIQTTKPQSTVPWDIGSYKTFSSFVKSGVPVKLGVG